MIENALDGIAMASGSRSDEPEETVMPELWGEVVGVVNTLLLGMPYHGLLLNERYLHHSFSHRVQTVHPSLMDLLDPAIPIQLHPEWPTYKGATKIDCGKYREENGRYMPVESGKRGGFIDFAFGPYLTPSIAVEFKLLFSWQAEAITFDYMKLLDGRNPFTSVVQVTVLMRPKGTAQGRAKDVLHESMDSAYREAVGRLSTIVSSTPVTDRRHRFVVTELSPGERRHWFHGAIGSDFTMSAEMHPLTE